MHPTADLQTVAQALATAYVTLFDADYVRFWWADRERREARVIHHYPPREFVEDWEWKKDLSGQSSVVKVITGGELSIVRDARVPHGGEPRFSQIYGILSGAHVPMRVDGIVVGDMAAVSKRETQHFTDADGPLLMACAETAALAISRCIDDATYAALFADPAA